MTDKGAIDKFVWLLNSKHPQICEKAIWALANIAGDRARYRDEIIKTGGLD